MMTICPWGFSCVKASTPIVLLSNFTNATLANDARLGRPSPIRGLTTRVDHQLNLSNCSVQCVECLFSSPLRILGGAIEIKGVRLGHPTKLQRRVCPVQLFILDLAHCLLYFLSIAPRSTQILPASHVSHVGGRPGDKDKGALFPHRCFLTTSTAHRKDRKTNKLTRSNVPPKQLLQISKTNGNDRCCDCGAPSPQWVRGYLFLLSLNAILPPS